MNAEDTKHPPAHRLDAMAAGDGDAATRGHVAICAECTRYVKELQDAAAAFRAKNDARAFVAKIEARANADAGANADADTGAKKPAKVIAWRRAWVAPVLAAAAALLLFVRMQQHQDHPVDGPKQVTESRFKGGMNVVVVRERDGAQERIAGPFTVRAGDRIRVEISTDHEGPLAAGLLADDGTWAPLLAPTAFEAGTHYSELAARFDESKTFATLLAGSPADVDHARQTRDFAGVVAVRVTSEASP